MNNADTIFTSRVTLTNFNNSKMNIWGGYGEDVNYLLMKHKVNKSKGSRKKKTQNTRVNDCLN